MYFVSQNSIVRKIWGQSDMVLLIFAGASAEFALNKAVDWLYFTGKLPADPLGRLFSTVVYSQNIVFAKEADAMNTISSMGKIHQQVENKRGTKIPQWAYRDVLFMLIDYSIRSYEALEGKMLSEEKEEVFQVFHKLGIAMKIEELPNSYITWLPIRETHLNEHYAKSELSTDLMSQYKKHLGSFRFKLLLESYSLVAPTQVKSLLNLKQYSFLKPLIPLFNLSRKLKIDWYFKSLLFPNEYKDRIKKLDYQN